MYTTLDDGSGIKLFSRKISYITLLRWSIALIYLWFGALKFFPNVSPAEEIAKTTVCILLLDLVPETMCLYLLAISEVLIGFALISGFKVRLFTGVTIAHMVCTFLPLVFFPGQSFGDEPLSLTLLGQYILKNLVIICALLIIRGQYKKEKLV